MYFRKTVVTGCVCGCRESLYKGGNSGTLPEIFAISEIGEHWLDKYLRVLCREIIAVCFQIHTNHINTAVWAECGIVEC
jgi:hypothetical protein